MNSVSDISLKVSEVIAAAPSFKQIRLDEETGGFRLYFEADFFGTKNKHHQHDSKACKC